MSDKTPHAGDGRWSGRACQDGLEPGGAVSVCRDQVELGTEEHGKEVGLPLTPPVSLVLATFKAFTSSTTGLRQRTPVFFLF